MTFGVVVHHEGESKVVTAFARQWGNDNTRSVAHNEGDLLCGCELCGHDEVAFVLAVFVVHHDNHLATCNCRYDIFNR